MNRRTFLTGIAKVLGVVSLAHVVPKSWIQVAEAMQPPRVLHEMDQEWHFVPWHDGLFGMEVEQAPMLANDYRMEYSGMMRPYMKHPDGRKLMLEIMHFSSMHGGWKKMLFDCENGEKYYSVDRWSPV